MTIVEAIKQVLEGYPNGLTSNEIYQKIVNLNIYQFNAQNPQAIVNGIIRRHCNGLEFPTASPHKHFEFVGKQQGKCRYAILSKDVVSRTEVVSVNLMKSEKLPEEKMEDNYNEHIEEIKSQLMNAIMKSTPLFFEHLVVELLSKMGYGAKCKDSKDSIWVNKTICPDGGIDGIIKEDELGLDMIYIQAKRYSSGNNIGSKLLDEFAGVMGKNGIKKGVFFTTSKFVKAVREQYSKPVDGKKISLVDGDELMKLIIQY